MKWYTKAFIALMFTHGVAYAHGHNRGVFSAFESIEKQQKMVERMARRSGLKESLGLTGSGGGGGRAVD